MKFVKRDHAHLRRQAEEIPARRLRSGRHLRRRLDKDEAEAHLADDVERLADLQERLYAEDRWAVLVILQGMDAAGKDGVIKHVMSGVNPQGCEVHSFKAPSAEELDHDFLWRYAKRLPERGRIGIFNRSYYEEVLIARVHPDVLAPQKLPRAARRQGHLGAALRGHPRLRAHLARNGTLVLKFFLHVSKEEQRRRLLDRLERAGQALEILDERHRRAQALGPLHGGLRGHDPRHQPCGGALARGAGRPQAASRIWWSPASWSTRWTGSILRFPKISRSRQAAAELAKVRKALLAESARIGRTPQGACGLR